MKTIEEVYKRYFKPRFERGDRLFKYRWEMYKVLKYLEKNYGLDYEEDQQRINDVLEAIDRPHHPPSTGFKQTSVHE